jgi:hypothetical protein
MMHDRRVRTSSDKMSTHVVLLQDAPDKNGYALVSDERAEIRRE